MPVSATELQAIVERIWRGDAAMEAWTAAIAGGVATPVADDVVAVSTSYLFGNVTAIRTRDGLVLIDSGSRETAHQTLAAIRAWDAGPIHTIVYTHGHIDHSWGARLLDAEADKSGAQRARIVAHRNALRRFARYDATHGLNSVVMGRQFNQPGYVFPDDHRRPDLIYDETLSLEIGGIQIELMHGRGETDDATFVWLPQRRILISGDFVIWVFPNAGNPRKVQRYAPDWAAALRRMRALQPEILIPGHGPVVTGTARVNAILDDGAAVLESLVAQTLALMNEGRTLDEILQRVQAPKELLEKPYLKPKYDDPEFVVRNIWHLYGGWYDGNPAHLKPAPDAALAAELATLAGSADKLATRAKSLLDASQTRLAAHIIEFAVGAEPDNKEFHRLRAEIYAACAAAETSLIGKAIFAVSQRESKARSEK